MTRTVFWLLLAAFILLGIWWIFHVPCQPDRVFAAIPADATVVTVHSNLAADLETILQNPATRNLIASMGVRERDLNDLATNEETRAWIRLLASDTTALAYVPALGYQRKPAWVLASWIGGQSRRLSWKLPWLRSRDLRPLPLANGRTVWIARTKFSDPTQRLSLALAEGVLLGCISADPIGVRWLLETNEGYPSWPSALKSGQLAAARALMPAHHAHWGWWRTGLNSSIGRFAPAMAAFDAGISPAGRLDLAAFTGQAMPPASPLGEHAGIGALHAFLGASPELIAVAPLAWVDALLPPASASLWQEAVAQLLDTNNAPADALAFVALLDRRHSGRIRSALGSSLAALSGKGLRVPSLLAGVQVANAAEASRRLQRVTSTLNARYGWNLALRPQAGPDTTMTLIVDEGSGLYAKFEPDECLAFMMIDDWLVLGSNAAVLRSLLAGRPPAGGTSVPAAWAKENHGAACLWIDLNDCGRTLKEGLAVAQLAIAVNESPGSAALLRNLAAARNWIDIAQSFRQATMEASVKGTQTRVNAVIEPP